MHHAHRTRSELASYPASVPSTSEPLRIHRNIARSLHFIRRAEERNLREDVLEFILTWGSEFYCSGALHLTVLERSLPRHLRDSPLAAKARDWVVLFSEESAALTCYRRAHAARYLRKKPKTRLSERQLIDRNANKHSIRKRIA